MFGFSQKNVRRNLTIARSNVKKRVEGASSHERLLYFSEFLEVSGIPSDVKFLIAAESHYWTSYFEKMSLARDVKELLTKLRLINIKVALVTNLVSGIQYRKLLHLGIENLFDVVITSQETNREKATFEPFSLLIERLQISETLNEVWFVGDEQDDFPSNFPCKNIRFFASPYSRIRSQDSKLIHLKDYKQLYNYLN